MRDGCVRWLNALLGCILQANDTTQTAKLEEKRGAYGVVVGLGHAQFNYVLIVNSTVSYIL